jgi:hypothetical protein
VAVVEHQDAPLIVSAGADRALRSWRLDGGRGALDVPNAHSNWIRAVAVVEHQGAPLIVSAGHDGAIVASQIAAAQQAAFP